MGYVLSIIWKVANAATDVIWFVKSLRPETQKEIVKKLQFLSWKATKKI